MHIFVKIWTQFAKICNKKQNYARDYEKFAEIHILRIFHEYALPIFADGRGGRGASRFPRAGPARAGPDGRPQGMSTSPSCSGNIEEYSGLLEIACNIDEY